MLCGSLGERGVWGRMDTCTCIAEFLYYHSVVNQLYSNTKLKVLKKKLTMQSRIHVGTHTL